MSAANERFGRTELLLGEAAMKRLQGTRVAIFGVGGVGGYVLEGLIRSGVEHIDVIDSDTVSVSNINRQIIATDETVGRLKVEVAAERARQINPDAALTAIAKFYSKDTASEFDLSSYNYIVDAIDTVSAKIELIVNATSLCVPIISSMGAGGKLDPCAFEVSDIYKTSVCPLARVMRSELKKCGVKKLKVVYSKEEPIKRTVDDGSVRHVPGSVSFVPSVVGLIIAGEIIKDIIK